MATYLQLIEKLSDSPEHFDERHFAFEEGFINEVFSILQNLSEDDTGRFEDMLNTPDDTLERDLPNGLSTEILREVFASIVILESPTVEQSLTLFRKFVKETGARLWLNEIESYEVSSYYADQFEQARYGSFNAEIKRKSKRAKLALAKNIISPEVVPYLCWHIRYEPSGLSESFAAQVIPEALLETDKVRLERVILFWDDMMSQAVRRTLRRVYLDAKPNSVVRANASRMLVLLGDARIMLPR